MPKKISENNARRWLKERFGSTNLPVRKLPKVKKWELKNPNQQLKLVFPLQISENFIHMTSATTKGRLLTCSAKKLIAENWDIVEEAVASQGWQPTYKTFLYADMDFYYSDNRVRDSHNMFKILFDSLQGIAFDNDYYLMPRVQSINLNSSNPRIELVLSVGEGNK